MQLTARFINFKSTPIQFTKWMNPVFVVTLVCGLAVHSTNLYANESNLTLTGVFMYADENKRIAIISKGSEDQSAYGVGDMITDDIELKAIEEDRITIDNDGDEEELALLDYKTPGIVFSKSPAIDDDTLEAPSGPTELRNNIEQDPSLLAKLISATPFKKDEEQIGYTIALEQFPAFFNAYGIQDGDVVTEVNGIAASDAKQAKQAMQDALKAPKLDINLLRNGEAVSTTVLFDVEPIELRNTIVEDVPLFDLLLSTAPFEKYGKLVGYKITPKQYPEFFASHDIQAGDVITQVNGVKVDSPEQATRALKTASNAPKLDITLLRENKEVSTSISFNQ